MEIRFTIPTTAASIPPTTIAVAIPPTSTTAAGIPPDHKRSAAQPCQVKEDQLRRNQMEMSRSGSTPGENQPVPIRQSHSKRSNIIWKNQTTMFQAADGSNSNASAAE